MRLGYCRSSGDIPGIFERQWTSIGLVCSCFLVGERYGMLARCHFRGPNIFQGTVFGFGTDRRIVH